MVEFWVVFLIVIAVGYFCKERAARNAEAEARAAKAASARAAEAKRFLERYHQLQRVVLACAKKEKGIVTPAAMVATARVSDHVTLDVARSQLDYMVQKGDLELHASESGVPPLVYVCPRVPNRCDPPADSWLLRPPPLPSPTRPLRTSPGSPWVLYNGDSDPRG